MKKLMLLLLLIPLASSAQEYITITEGTYGGFMDEEVPVYTIEVQDVTREGFLDHWYGYLKSKTKNDIDKSSNELHTASFPIKAMGGRLVDVYMHFEDMDKGTRLYMAIKDSALGFISMSNPDYGIATKKLIYEETHKVFIETKKDALDDEEDHLEELEGEYEKLVKNEDKTKHKILKSEQEIDKLKNDITINQGVMEELTTEVADKRSELNGLSASVPDEVKKKAEKELSSTEKKRDNLRKKIEKATDQIQSLEEDIRDYKYEMEKKQPEIDMAKTKASDQREKVTKLQEELYQLNRKI